MTQYPDLLPPNATKLEKSIAGSTGRLTDIPVLIDDLIRHDTCPEPLLPWLAWAMSVDFWDDSWPAARKRNIIRESFELHRKKGTLYGIKRYLSYADADCLKAITPPDKAFAMGSFTPEDRDAWLARFPQIRIYDYADRGKIGKGAMIGGSLRRSNSFLGAGLTSYRKATAFPIKTDAEERYGRRPFIWDRGGHPLATGEFKPIKYSARFNDQGGFLNYEYERVLMPEGQLKSLWIGENAKGNINGRLFPLQSVAARRIVTMKIDADLGPELYKFAIPPSLDPIDVNPTRIYERGKAKRGIQVFGGFTGIWLDPQTQQRKKVRGFVKGYLPPTGSRTRIYDRIAFHDKRRMPNGRPFTRHIGDIRLGMPAYNAELYVSVKDKRPKKQTNGFVFGYTLTASEKPLQNARLAIISASSLRDKILMRTTLNKLVEVGPETKVGSNLRVGRAVLLLT